jgi:uncharacterized membrane protein YfcA
MTDRCREGTVLMTIFTAERILGLIALGFCTGAYGTLIGAGGGFVLMPVLLLLYPHQSPETLTSISLAVVFFNALSGTEAYAMMKRIDYKSGFMFALATIPGAIIGALQTAHVPRSLFDGIFGVLLLSAAAFLITHPNFKEKSWKKSHTHSYLITRNLVEADGSRYSYSFNPLIGVVLSCFVGYVSSFLGIGGGIIHVPALVYFLNFPVHIATATSHFMLAIMALTGTLVHILTGTFSHGVNQTLSLAIGVVLGAQLGAHVSNRIKGNWIIRSLAIALGLVGIRILMLALHAI